MGRFGTSAQLARTSWGVLKQDRSLALLPVISALVSIPLLLLVGGSLYFTFDRTERLGVDDEVTPTFLTYVIGGAGYLLVVFVGTFFTAALVAGAMERFRGGTPTVASSLSWASQRLVPIFGWAMLAGTVGLVLRALEQRLGVLGQVVVRLVGAAWQIVTWLAIPVVIDQGTGPFTSLRTAAGLFRRTWGENLIVQAGLGIVGFVVAMAGVVVAVAIGAALPIFGLVLAVVWLAVVAIVFAALGGILRTAVYLYASGQPVPGFDQQTLASMFGPRPPATRWLGR